MRHGGVNVANPYLVKKHRFLLHQQTCLAVSRKNILRNWTRGPSPPFIGPTQDVHSAILSEQIIRIWPTVSPMTWVQSRA